MFFLLQNVIMLSIEGGKFIFMRYGKLNVEKTIMIYNVVNIIVCICLFGVYSFLLLRGLSCPLE